MVTPRARATASSSACVTPYLIAACSGSPLTTSASISDAASRNVVISRPRKSGATWRSIVAVPVPHEIPVRVHPHPSTARRHNRRARPDRRQQEEHRHGLTWLADRSKPRGYRCPAVVNPSCTAPARIAAWSSAKKPARTGTVRTSAILEFGAVACERLPLQTLEILESAVVQVEPMTHEQQRCLVLLPVIARDAVDCDHDVQIVEHRVASCRTRHIPRWCNPRSPRS